MRGTPHALEAARGDTDRRHGLLRHDGRVDALPFCFDAGGNLFMLVLDAERYGCVDLCFADGWTQEPTGLDAEQFFRILHADLGPQSGPVSGKAGPDPGKVGDRS